MNENIIEYYCSRLFHSISLHNELVSLFILDISLLKNQKTPHIFQITIIIEWREC